MNTSQLTTKAEQPRVTSDKITPEDVRYADLAKRGANKRFVGKPDYIRLVGSTEQVIDAVQEAVSDNLRLVVRSGGHCLEGFVADPAVQVVIDTSLMTNVYYDAEMNAFAVEAGVTVGEMYRKLFLGWGVTIPAGISPNIGVGGHIVGGAFGYLNRQLGLAADYLYAVEVVVVDKSGTAISVVATREASDPNRDLWWAHTGGGGGNFGIITRYWFRSLEAKGSHPSKLLPKAPDSALRFKAVWNWKDIDEAGLKGLLRNYGDWCEANSAADSPFAQLYSTIFVPRQSEAGKIELTGVITAGNESKRLLDDHLTAINQDIGATYTLDVDQTSLLAFALYPFPDLVDKGSVGGVFKLKDAFLRKRLTDKQIDVVYHYLTSSDYAVGGGMGMTTYGGKTNTIAPDATASAQRESVITMSCSTGWSKPEDEAPSLKWVRELYRDIFAETGGVPVPNAFNNGALINHPDVDLADPAWNTSGVAWSTIYYKDNYPRLQQIKAKYDPRNVFHHALSIKAQ